MILVRSTSFIVIHAHIPLIPPSRWGINHQSARSQLLREVVHQLIALVLNALGLRVVVDRDIGNVAATIGIRDIGSTCKVGSTGCCTRDRAHHWLYYLAHSHLHLGSI